jgi:Raf kinase inhibitor-like YbhB/YbcL family protein
MVAAVLLAMTLLSGSFHEGSMLPKWTAHGDARCPGEDRSPELHWSDVPTATRSFALIVFDPDARGGWYHWVAYDLPARTRRLPSGVTLPATELGETSFNAQRYGGPCPPLGPAHHYIFTLYALDVPSLPAEIDIPSLGIRSPLTGPVLLLRMRGHVLAKATLVGRYSYGRR